MYQDPSTPSSLKVLVAEDDRATRRTVARLVERLGHRCVDVPDGAQALALYEEGDFDVIISDWVMPGMSGDELCREIRSKRTPTYTCFILLTVLDDHQYRLEGMRAGAGGFLTKPLNRDEFEARLIIAERMAHQFSLRTMQ